MEHPPVRVGQVWRSVRGQYLRIMKFDGERAACVTWNDEGRKGRLLIKTASLRNGDYEMVRGVPCGS